MLPRFLSAGDGASSACLCYKITRLLFPLVFGPDVAKANMFFHRPLYCDAAKNNINSCLAEGGSLLAEGFLRAPCFRLYLSLPFTIVQRGLTAASGTPLQSPHPQPCPRRAAFPSIYPRRAAPHQFQWKDPCLPPPKSREITSNNVFPTL